MVTNLMIKRILVYGLIFITLTLCVYIVMLNQLNSITNPDQFGDYGGFPIRTGRKITTKQVKQEDETVIPATQLKQLLRDAENDNNIRLQKIQKVCETYKLGLYGKSNEKNSNIVHPPVPQYGVFYFDIPNKWSICPIFKAGSSTWLYNLLLLGGMNQQEINNSSKQLSDLARAIYPELEPGRAEDYLQLTTKVLTVRHPFERVLSAYRDKLENVNHGQEHGTVHFYRKYGSKIVKKYRLGGNDTKTWTILSPVQYLWNPGHEKPAGIEPTFKEFVRYLSNLDLANYADDHWIPYYLYCTPCLLNYDIVAKVETLDRDQLYVIGVLGLKDKIKPRWRHKTQFLTTGITEERGTSNNDAVDNVSPVAKIYFSQLTIEEIEKLFEKYKLDFELFGYSPEEYFKYAADNK